MKISFVRLDSRLPPPRRAHDGDAAVDLYCRERVMLGPGDRATVPTGLQVAIPEGYAGFVLPRSGHAMRSGVGVVNGPGLIDSGYRGEIGVILINHGSEPVIFEMGDRIAQMAVLAVPEVEWEEETELDETTRGDGGFGSTGL